MQGKTISGGGRERRDYTHIITLNYGVIEKKTKIFLV